MLITRLLVVDADADIPDVLAVLCYKNEFFEFLFIVLYVYVCVFVCS